MNRSHIGALGLLVAMVLVAPAAAHVTLTPAALPAGVVHELIFHCPNERPAAATTELLIQLPQAYPLALVKVPPIPGWRATVTMRRLTPTIHTRRGDVTTAVDTIAWTGGSIRPGEHQDFAILAGPMPHGVSTLVFKAIQTYSNGDTERWIDLRSPGDVEPPFPAPVLHLR